MENKDLLHVQIRYEEALESKKEILSSEANLLRIKHYMKNYHILRKDEIKSKLKVYRKIKELLASLNQLQKNLPKIHIPKEIIREKVYREKSQIEKTEPMKKLEKMEYDHNLEKQLREIQEKLRSLGR